MKRLFLLILVVLMAVGSGLGNTMAQTPVAGDLVADDLLVRVEGDEHWAETQNALGMPAKIEEYQLINGEPQFELFPTALALYRKYGAQDVYYYDQRFDELPLKDSPVSTVVETRVLVFPDAASAAGYLSDAYQAQVDSETEGEVVNAQFAPIEPLPAFDNPSVGWTFLDEYYDLGTFETTGYISSARFLSQVDRFVVSASASGPWVDFNFDLAASLLNEQVECVKQSSPCDTVTITDLTSPDWSVESGELVFADSYGTAQTSRYLYPAEEPVRAPFVSTVLATPVAVVPRESGKSGE